MTQQDTAGLSGAGLDRVIRMEAINNFRDFGGMPTMDGGRVRTGRLFRSAHHARASAADQARLAALGLRTVVDLRRPAERALQPSAWRGVLPIAVLEEADGPGEGGASHDAPHVAAFAAGEFSPAAAARFLARRYGEFPYEPRHVRLFARAFAALAQGGPADEGGLLIHCAAGKDRTGLLVWLTHHLLGVHPDDAMADYLLSNDAADLASRVPAAKQTLERAHGRTIPDEAVLALYSVSPDYIARSIAAITARSGSLDAYLVDVLGVLPCRREAARARLLA